MFCDCARIKRGVQTPRNRRMTSANKSFHKRQKKMCHDNQLHTGLAHSRRLNPAFGNCQEQKSNRPAIQICLERHQQLCPYHLHIVIHVPRAPAAVARYVPAGILRKLLQLPLGCEAVSDPKNLHKRAFRLLQTSAFVGSNQAC